MNEATKVAAMVAAAKRALGPNKSVSVKIRLHKDINDSIDFVRTVQQAGVDFVAVHARLKNQRSSTPPDLKALKILRSHFPDLPMLANGDVYSLAHAERTVAETGVDGVMTARGLQENPALFAGYESTPREVVERFMAYAVRSGLRFELIKGHLADMMGKMTTKKVRRTLIGCKDLIELVDWLDGLWDLKRFTTECND